MFSKTFVIAILVCQCVYVLLLCLKLSLKPNILCGTQVTKRIRFMLYSIVTDKISRAKGKCVKYSLSWFLRFTVLFDRDPFLLFLQSANSPRAWRLGSGFREKKRHKNWAQRLHSCGFNGCDIFMIILGNTQNYSSLNLVIPCSKN